MSLKKWYEDVASSEEFLKQLYARSKAEGAASIPNWYTDRDIDATGYPDLRCELSWDENDCQTVMERFTQLKNALMAIAARDRKYDAERSEEGCLTYEQGEEGCLTYEQEEVEETYLTPWETDVCDLELMDDIFGRSFYHDELTDDEQELLEHYQAELNADAVRRIGEGSCAFQQVNLAKRLYTLYKMGAPAVILCREECLLAAAMAIHAFGKSVVAISPRKLPI